ncbi:hypothetical protein YC2023_024156 [Brassica napus]
MKVRDGLSTSFWHDIWTDMGCLSDLIGAGGFIEMGIRSTATVASPVARRDRMATWSSGISSLCIFCHQETATHEHIFFDCAYPTAVW